jgi:hypothetical protein
MTTLHATRERKMNPSPSKNSHFYCTLEVRVGDHFSSLSGLNTMDPTAEVIIISDAEDADETSRVAKRPRLDKDDITIPTWLLESHLPYPQLRDLIRFLETKNYCIARNTFNCRASPQHLVTVGTAMGEDGYCTSLVCNACAERCECCNTPCVYRYDNDDEEVPHHWVCHACRMDPLDCGHEFPETCPTCKRGYMDDEEVCPHCMPDDNDNDD